MTIDIKVRGILENAIDSFINTPKNHIGFAEGRAIKSKVDFILGFFYGRMMIQAMDALHAFQIPEKKSDPDEIFDLLDRRALEITDAIQRELEKEGNGGNSI
jgi:hypothetical protein